MLASTPIKESQGTAVPPPDSVTLSEQFSPLCEKAVRRDGTIGLRLIAPGWGSSGYYGREMLERDIPKVFPAGTQMFWNHATVTEEMERPEGDLRNLAAVTISTPIWLDAGPKGPGMYADAKPFAGYSAAIDEIGEHIGVSIRGLGRHTQGTAEGRDGRIIQELVMGKSVDFVTAPGAGGGIVKVFEAAPGGGRLPAPTVASFLAEAGRVLSATNEKRLRAALGELTAVLSLLDDTGESAKRLAEARNIGEWLESRLHLSLTQIADDMYGEGRVSREERKAMSSAIGAALNAYRADLMTNASPLFKRDVWALSPDSEDIAAMSGGVSESNTEADMDSRETQDTLADRDKELAESRAALAKANELLLLREARDFVTEALAKAELPDVTKIRLGRELTANPPTKEGKVDEAELTKRIETAVNEARAEIATITGRTGQVTGQGESAAAGNGSGSNGTAVPAIAESQKRTQAALAGLGYGTVQEA